MMRVLVVLILLSSTLAGWTQGAPACTASQLSAATDPENGNFDGMSHSGTLLVLRNIGPKACTMPGFPALTFADAAGKPLAITREVPKGMHPGPVIVPATVVPGAEVTATLRWVSSNVDDSGQCFAVSTITIAIGTGTQTAALEANLLRASQPGDVYDDAPGTRPSLNHPCQAPPTPNKLRTGHPERSEGSRRSRPSLNPHQFRATISNRPKPGAPISPLRCGT